MAQKKKRGTAGNAVQYITRNQALNKLQLKLSEFRRLCILKGIHPREPRKKVKGQNKTYYHIKDINFLLHEPLLKKVRELHAYEKKIRRALAKQNRDLARRLDAQRPSYRLDHLIKERYPSFIDALRDLDDPLSLIHLFAVLPAEATKGIPTERVTLARRLALEWQAWVVRTSSLRRVFVSVKGYYFQAEVQGQLVTWLVPHPLAQVLPNDVDYKVMLTFLELYSTMVRFVLAKLYHDNGLKYPPVLEASLEEAGTGLQAIVHQSVGDADGGGGGDGDEKQKQKRGKKSVVNNNNNNNNKEKALPQQEEEESDEEEEDDDEEIDSEEEEEEEEENEEGIEQRLKSLNAKVQQLQQEIIAGEDDQGTGGKKQKDLFEAGDDDDSDSEDEDLEIDSGSDEDEEEDAAADPEDGDIPAAKIKGTITLPTPDDDDIHEENDDIINNDDDDDDSAVFSTLFKGLVFFLGREVPKEQLLIVIRSFGGEAGWEGEGSPLAKSDPAITHQVMDRPPPSAADGGLQALYNDISNSHPGGGGGGRRREFIQPQWVFDSANARVLVRGELYAPGQALPPHLSPFVNEDEEGYVPEYGQQLKELREAALAAKRASSQKGGGVLGSGGEEGFIGEKKGGKGRGGGGDDGETEEAIYAAELAKELGGGGVEKVGRKRRAAAGAGDGDGDDQEALKDVMMTRKTKKMYATLKKQERAKKARVEELETKAKKLK